MDGDDRRAQVDKWWASEIEKRTSGEIKIKIFYEGVLGKANENLALIQNGSIDLAAMSPSYFPAELPFHSAPNSIPMAMARVEEATELMERLLTEVPEFDEEAKRNGMKALFFHHLNPYLLVCKEPAGGVDDMAGRKVRTWGRDMPRMVQAAGAVPVTLGLADLYEALGRGTVDCIPFSVDPDDQLPRSTRSPSTCTTSRCGKGRRTRCGSRAGSGTSSPPSSRRSSRRSRSRPHIGIVTRCSRPARRRSAS